MQRGTLLTPLKNRHGQELAAFGRPFLCRWALRLMRVASLRDLAGRVRLANSRIANSPHWPNSIGEVRLAGSYASGKAISHASPWSRQSKRTSPLS